MEYIFVDKEKTYRNGAIGFRLMTRNIRSKWLKDLFPNVFAYAALYAGGHYVLNDCNTVQDLLNHYIWIPWSRLRNHRSSDVYLLHSKYPSCLVGDYKTENNGLCILIYLSGFDNWNQKRHILSHLSYFQNLKFLITRPQYNSSTTPLNRFGGGWWALLSWSRKYQFRTGVFCLFVILVGVKLAS